MGVDSRTWRREFLKVTAAGAAGASLLGVSTLAAGCSHPKPSPNPPNDPPANSGMNVIVVIIDSLRKDHVGVYGNDLMSTPTLDALAKESLRFNRAHPEAMPTIPARRAIHTGFRTWPTRAPAYGWKPIPEEQPTLAEILKGQGYHTMLVTDTYHEFMPPMNFHRGFDVLRTFRGQEQDRYKDPTSVSEEEMQRYLVLEPIEIRQYLANTQGRRSEEDWFAAKVFSEATRVLEQAVLDGADRGQPFLLVVDCYDPPRALGSAREVRKPLRSRRLRGQGAVEPAIRRGRLPDRSATLAYAGAVLRRGRYRLHPWLQTLRSLRAVRVSYDGRQRMLADHRSRPDTPGSA